MENVKHIFNRQISEGLHPGAGLAVYRYGSMVLDIHGGVADSGTGRRVDDKTMFVLFSSTKPLAGACVYMLKERGRLDWDDPVAKFWPEFGQNGKESVTIRHLLSHQGGFPDTPADLPWADWHDWSLVCAAMERATPKFTPGSTLSYHPINYGWVIAELVRRIDGRTFDRFIADDLAAPLQMNDTYVGLPDRAGGPRFPHSPDGAGRRHQRLRGQRLRQARKSTGSSAPAPTASPPPATWPASTRPWSARATLDGARVLRPETVAEGITMQVEGIDRSLELFAQRALGFALNDERMGQALRQPDAHLWPRRGRHLHRLGRPGHRAGGGLHHQRLPGRGEEQRPAGRDFTGRARRLRVA